MLLKWKHRAPCWASCSTDSIPRKFLLFSSSLLPLLPLQCVFLTGNYRNAKGKVVRMTSNLALISVNCWHQHFPRLLLHIIPAIKEQPCTLCLWHTKTEPARPVIFIWIMDLTEMIYVLGVIWVNLYAVDALIKAEARFKNTDTGNLLHVVRGFSAAYPTINTI